MTRTRGRGRGIVALCATLAVASGAGAALPSATATTPHAALTEPPADEGDASLRLGAVPYHDLAPRLNALAASSDRVRVQAIGRSTQGRELLMVTVTAPETPAQRRAQARMRDRITEQPAQAAGDRALARAYKLPVLVDANIHGNEWEGTDAALRLVADLATATDPATEELLERHRIHLVLTANPDGRVAGTRRNAAGFDLNRDLVTASQPESRAVRDAIIATQPALVVDLHGYVNGTLVEPTTPPHGEAYELDLVMRHSYPVGLAVEAAIQELGHDEASDGVRPPVIPLRDWDEGWDGWPPIFVPQYAALHGAVAHTVEIPLRVNNASYDLPEAELRRRSAINTDVAHAAITATVGYAAQHREELLADQIEIFHRGEAGERQRTVPEGLADGLIGPEDVYLTDYPRAYVIPVGEGQRSAPAAARLVDHLLANDVEVTRLSKAATLGGHRYPAGSYVVDLHQAKRAVAQTLLGPGTDISDRVEAMYDISGWSLGLLWGASVAAVPEGDPLRVVGKPASQADATGSLATSSTGWVLPLADPADVAALTELLAQGVPVELLDDGSVLVGAGWPWAAGHAAEAHGVGLAAAPRGASGAVIAPTARRVGVAAGAEERFALEEMGFVVEPVTTAALNDGLDLSELDALYVSSDLTWRELDAGARAELRSFVADGGGLVGRGPTGSALNDALDLLDVTAVAGRADANGVVRVVNDPASPVAAAATEHTFVYSPLWFTDLGRGVAADQRYADDPLVSGHWRADGQGHGGPDAAGGEAALVSGDAGEGRAVLLGTEPLFRAHPKGQYALVARALLWACAEH